MKITFISHVFPYPQSGYNPGIERVIWEISHALAKKGHEIHVITTRRNGSEIEDDVIDSINIHRIKDSRSVLGKTGSLGSLDLISINLAMHRYDNLIGDSDIIHTFTPILEKVKCPIVSHFHHQEHIRGIDDLSFVPASRLLWKRTYSISDAIISVSDYSSNDLIKNGISKDKIFTIYNGVDIGKFRPIDGDNKIHMKFKNKRVLLYVGPIIGRKGLITVIDALPEIVRYEPNTLFVIVGKGNNADLMKRAKELGVQDNVIFEGFVDEADLSYYYNSCDIFVFPSLQEGFGMAVAEAMACGKSTICSNITAIPEVVGDAGILVKPQNAKAISESVISLMADNTLRRKYELKARERVLNNFTWDIAADKLIQVYSGLS